MESRYIMRNFCTQILFAVILLSGFAQTINAQSDQRIVAETLLGEARGEGQAGLYAVACVIQARVNDKRWPSTGRKGCLQSNQFDYWNAKRQRRTCTNIFGSKHASYAMTLAKAIVARKQLKDITRGANHFVGPGSNPKHIRGKKPVFIYKRHRFYKL